MSSLPKQHNFIQPSSSPRQSPFRAASSANPSTATSRPRPIGASSEHNKRSDASYTQLGDNPQQHDDHEPAPERPFEGAEADYDDHDHDHDNRPKPARTNFKPFFTLIEDANSSDYHHPTVHYIFSDDDAELMTEASLRALETGHHTTSPPRNDSEEGLDSADQQSSHHPENDRPSLLPPPIPGVKERFIVLDVEQSATAIGNPSSAPDALLAGTSAGTGTTVVSSSPAQRQQQQQSYGYRIVSAHSLTPDWQVLDASLSPAPTFDTPQQNTGDQASVSNTLMLRIEGTGGYARDIPVGKDKEGQQTLEEMMEQFDKRMAELRRVIETSGDHSPLGATAQPGGDDGPRAGEEEEKQEEAVAND